MVTIEQKGKRITFPLVQNVTVMATGQRSTNDTKNGERRQYSTATLDTTPEQAQSIIVAREAGKITALLRNPRDKRALPNARGDVAALLGIKNGKGEAFEEADRQIPVLYGGRGGKLPPEGLKLGQYVSAADSVKQAALGAQVPALPNASGQTTAASRP